MVAAVNLATNERAIHRSIPAITSADGSALCAQVGPNIPDRRTKYHKSHWPKLSSETVLALPATADAPASSSLCKGSRWRWHTPGAATHQMQPLEQEGRNTRGKIWPSVAAHFMRI